MVEKLFEERNPNPTDSVLDAGCGSGDFIDGIIRWCNKNDLQLPRITGVELDPKYASEAEKKFQEYSAITIEQSDYLAPTNEKYDFIIGNPPYVPISQLSEEEKKRYRSFYKTAVGRFDMYLLFFEKSLNSLKENGRLVFITPEKYTYVRTAKPLRRMLANMNLKEIQFLKEDTFQGLTTYPIITIVENSFLQKEVKVNYRNGTSRHASLPKNGESWLSVLNGEKNEMARYKLEDVCIRISCGVATGADEVFIRKTNLLDSSLRLFAYPTISGKELLYEKELPDPIYSILTPYDENGVLIPFDELGSLGQYLTQSHIMKRLKARTCVKQKPWYAFHETPPMKDLLSPKILCKDISANPSFWLDKDGQLIPRHSIYYIIPKNAKKIHEILEYLQSDGAQEWLMKNCQRAANNFIRLQSSVLKKLPISKELYSSFNNESTMISRIEPHIFSAAVRTYWQTRSKQKRTQEEKGSSDTGARRSVTGGQQMIGFSDKIVELLVASGISVSDIYTRNKKDLPGFFRPHKGWDIVVLSQNKLLAAIELKSQVGPSFGNNFNNRTEEALGSALDFWTAYREKAFGISPQPWLGYIFLLEDCSASHKTRLVREPHFPVLPEFKKTSYAKRYELLCRKLVLERQYNAACLILADQNKAETKDNYFEPAADLAVNQFLIQLLNHVNLYTNLKTTQIDQYSE